ncbi:unnamed protein product [Adineta steineri]|uniref:Uncharacterized protein n=4 Tax=Adineta steineri TaxID=433720 RepID=A0A815EME7_9BILA|nr:unnamed protein product [Adineta steineri]CAF1313476.1 unnamed protein product [Adineta steineri]CAF3508262.1 unnamed protein product [Adineta steineri]CAF3588760.1 unnamed protein product [Adineta steineri]
MTSNNSNDDDVPILDVTSDNDQTPLLNDNPILSTPNVDTILVPSISRYRLTNIIRILLFVEFVTILIIWLVGTSTHSLIDDIIHYRLTTSIFDLVAISISKFILLIIFLTELETFIIARLYQPNSRPLFIFIRYFYIVSLIVLSICSLAFAIIKLIFVLRAFHLSKLYLSTVYVFLVFSSIEFIGMILMIPYLSRVKLLEQPRSTKKKVDLKRLFSLSKSERPFLITGTLFLLLSSLTQIVQPYFFGRIVDDALTSDSMRPVTNDVLILFGINCVGAIASFLRSWVFELAGQRVVYRLRQNIFDSIIKQEVGFFDITRTGELTNRLSSDTQVLQNAVTVNISMLLRSFLQIAGSLVVMFYLEVSLTLVLMVIVPVIILFSRQYGIIVRKLRKQFQDELAGAGTTSEESISNIRTIRIFGAEKRISNHYHENLLKSYQVGKKLALNSGLFMGLVGFLAAGGIALVMWYGGKLVHERKLSTGTLASFLMYLLQVAVAFGMLASLFGDFMQAAGASERLFDLLDRIPKIPATSTHECSIKPDDFDGSIRVDKLFFTYPTRSDQQVLRDITFEIKSGQKVALVGPSGGGKSTIASLIERFYDPDSGTIYFGSHPLTSIDPKWLRENVSFVNQEPTLFACSIRDNITFGLDRTDISLDEIHSVAKQANAHDFIEQFENKYDTLVGERGVRLSGGQRQRIAIARALLMSPKLLLLDEATSALDAESEHFVQEAIERAMIDRTVLVIAHRLSTVRNADVVIVINQGTIVEQMAGLCDDCLPLSYYYQKLNLDRFEIKQNRNTIASIVAGSLFTIGWWLIIDVCIRYPSNDQFHKALLTIGIIASLALIFVNSISNSRFHGDYYRDGCIGLTLARVILFLSFLFVFGSVIAGAWLMIALYMIPNAKDIYPGVALFIQTLLIFASTLILKFGRTEDD